MRLIRWVWGVKAAANYHLQLHQLQFLSSQGIVRSRSPAIRSITTQATTKLAKKQNKSDALRWNVYKDIMERNIPITDLFNRLYHEVKTRGVRCAPLRQVIDGIYFHSVQQAHTVPLSSDFVREILDYFYQDLFIPSQSFTLGKELNEGVFSAIVKLHLVQDDVDKAWDLVNRLHDVTQCKVHFRMVGPILEYECRRGDAFDGIMTQWQALKRKEMEWTRNMENTIVQMISAWSRASIPRWDHLEELLNDLRLATKEITHENAIYLKQAFEATNQFRGSLVSFHETSTCPACFATLCQQHVTDTERAALRRAIESSTSSRMRTNTKTPNDLLHPFKTWLLAKHHQFRASADVSKLHFILDGPNLAYMNQNFDGGRFRFDHIDQVARSLQAQGHCVTITIPLTYLESKSCLHIRTRKVKQLRKESGKSITRQRTPSETLMIQEWREKNWVYSCRTDLMSDDLFWLYASVVLGTDAQVITNDLGRDHVHALVGKRNKGMTTLDGINEDEITLDVLERWRSTTITTVEIKHQEVTLQELHERTATSPAIPIIDLQLLHPPLFARIPQLNRFPKSESATELGWSIHIPVANTNTKWLCLHTKK